MPINFDDLGPAEVIWLQEQYCEELERRAEKLYERSRELRREMSALQLAIEKPKAQTNGKPSTPDVRLYSVGADGEVTEVTCIQVAKDLGTFTRAEFAKALGLKPGAQTMKWINILIRRRGKGMFPVIERRPDGSYAYLPPPRGMTEHPHRMPPEKALIDHSIIPVRGLPVRVSAANKATRSQRSQAGAGGVKGFKQRDERYEKMVAARAAAAEKKREKAKATTK